MNSTLHHLMVQAGYASPVMALRAQVLSRLLIDHITNLVIQHEADPRDTISQKIQDHFK